MTKSILATLLTLFAVLANTTVTANAGKTVDVTENRHTEWTENGGVRNETEYIVWTYSDGHQNDQTITRTLVNGKVTSENVGEIYVLTKPSGTHLFEDMTTSHPQYSVYEWANDRKLFDTRQDSDYRCYSYDDTTRGYFLWLLYNGYYDVVSSYGRHAGNPSAAKDLKKSEAYYYACRWAILIGIVDVRGGQVGRDTLTTPKWEAQVLTRLAKKIDGRKLTWSGLSGKSTLRCHSLERIRNFASHAHYKPHGGN